MRRAAILPALLCVVLALGGCGSDDPEQPAAPPAPEGTQIDVHVTGAGKPQQLACGEDCDEAAIAEVLEKADDPTRVCTDIYGGPEEAHVTGTLRGDPVDTTLTRANGCAIADYEALFEALGADPPIAVP